MLKLMVFQNPQLINYLIKFQNNQQMIISQNNLYQTNTIKSLIKSQNQAKQQQIKRIKSITNKNANQQVSSTKTYKKISNKRQFYKSETPFKQYKKQKAFLEYLPKVLLESKQQTQKLNFKNRYLCYLTNIRALKQKPQLKKRKQVKHLQFCINQNKNLKQQLQNQYKAELINQNIQQIHKNAKEAQEKSNFQILQKVKKWRQIIRKQSLTQQKKMPQIQNNQLQKKQNDQIHNFQPYLKQQNNKITQQNLIPSYSVEKKIKQAKLKSYPYIKDLNQWKRKNRISPQTNVFIITGGYADLRRALLNRGWVENPDANSPCFDFKWTLLGKQIDYANLLDFQIVNHFQKNGAISTKIGLCKNIRNMVWVNNIQVDQFYPKCFYLNDEDQYKYFSQYFKVCKAQSILLQYLKFYLAKDNIRLQKLKLRAKLAIQVCKRNMADINDFIDEKKSPLIITQKQWEILAVDQLNSQTLAKKKHEQWLGSIDKKYNQKKTEKSELKKKRKKKKQDQQKNNQQQQQKLQDQQIDVLTKDVITIIQAYKQKYPQASLVDIHNIWIIKPAGLSRGRGITCYNNLVQIQDHIKSKQSLWVAQKYIQKPLIIHRRKFDIRQWILISDFNPLTIWFFDQCYVRFSVLDYNSSQISNKFIHLTNNAIASLHKNFEKSQIKGNMFSMRQFQDYLFQKEGHDIFNQKIKPQFKDIVKWSLQSAQQHIQNRKNSNQLFGYDFMVDQQYKVWLIQINSSPSMDYSTHITTRLVKQCLEDTIKVVVDYNFATKKTKKTIDTGKFQLLYKGPQIPEKPISNGLSLNIEGIGLKKGNKRNYVKQTNFTSLRNWKQESDN